MLSRRSPLRSSGYGGGLAAALLLLLLLMVSFDVPADAAAVASGTKKRLLSFSSSPPRSPPVVIITSIAKLRSAVSPSASDLPLLLETGHSLARSDGVSPHALPAFADDGALALLARGCASGLGRQHPSVAAVVGGALANDVVRAVSKKGSPAVDNLFCFSLVDGKGVVERLGEVAAREEEVKGGGGSGGGGKEKEEEEVEVV